MHTFLVHIFKSSSPKQLEQMKTNLSWSLSSKLMFLIQIQDKWCQSWNLNKNPGLWNCYKKNLHLWFFFGWSIKFVFHACLKSKMAAVTVEHKLLLGLFRRIFPETMYVLLLCGMMLIYLMMFVLLFIVLFYPDWPGEKLLYTDI